MKENKFLFYGAIILIIICEMWLKFYTFRDAEFVQGPEVIEIENSLTGEFMECSSRFESNNWTQETNGRSIERYYATITISCDCVSDDEVIEKTETYQYFSEPGEQDLDCNHWCPEICSE